MDEKGLRKHHRVPPRFLLLFVLAATVALLVPHLVDGHLLAVEPALAQTIILAADMALAYGFYHAYRQDMMKQTQVRRTIESRLTDSYRYIGRKNVEADIMRTFMNALAKARSSGETKAIFRELQGKITVSVLKSRASVIRVIAAKTLRTITEFWWQEDEHAPLPTFANRSIVDTSQGDGAEDRPILTSEYSGGSTVCAMVFSGQWSEVQDMDLAATLLNQFHLVYTAAGLPRDGGPT